MIHGLATAALVALCIATPAAAETENQSNGAAPTSTGIAVDTATVIGTPRTGNSAPTGPQIEAPGWNPSDPGVPEADTRTLTPVTAPPPPVATRNTAPSQAGTGGRSEGGKFPWWVLLVIGGAIWAAQ